jgi:excisionase family DNA binding protein
MCPQSQPSEPNRSSGQSVARGPFDAERPTWLTAAEAAAYLNFKVRTILLWARQGRVKAYALTGTQRRVWRFLQVDGRNRNPEETCGKLGAAVRAR